MKARILKVPYDSGHRCERMARGPGYLLSKSSFRDSGIPVEAVETTLPFALEVQTAFDLSRQIAARVQEIRSEGELPVVLSGNCNSAIGTVSGLGPRETAVLWFDAHGEFNTPETTRSGFFDGMPLAVLTGRCWRLLATSVPGHDLLPEEHVILAGVRQTDEEEQSALDASGINQISAAALNRDPVAALRSALDQIEPRARQLYVHLDLDALDPGEATANEWVPPGGLRLSAIAESIQYASGRIPLGAIALASLDPSCDADGRALRAAERLLKQVISAAAS
jgi:arginase